MEILQKIANNQRQLGILLDPDKFSSVEDLDVIIPALKQIKPHLILVGGSLVNNDIFDDFILYLKKEFSHIPIVLFPGNNRQISRFADGILLLSLISGRNAEYLIGQHVQSAFHIKESNLEILPTGYVLVAGGRKTSVEYMSNTQSIPNDKTGIISATALAGEQLGLKLIYLDAGSGASQRIKASVIQTVRKNITLPLIVGGGIRSKTEIEEAWNAGANLVIVGSAFEDSSEKFVQDYTDNTT